MKSDLKYLAKFWAICMAAGFVSWVVVLYFFLQPLRTNPQLDSEQLSIISYAMRNYFYGPFSVEIRGTIGRDSIHYTRISGYIILSLIPLYLGIKNNATIKKALRVTIALAWAIHPFINLYLWNTGN